MNKLYVLDHNHEVYRSKKEKNRKFLDYKLIGIFYSNKQARVHLEKYKQIKGFKNSVADLKITEYIVDSIYNNCINTLLNSSLSPCMLNEVYGLYYVFEYPDGYEDVNLLGLFSSEAICKEIKMLLGHDSRFDKFLDYICIFKHQVNELQWKEGFIKWADALETLRKNEQKEK